MILAIDISPEVLARMRREAQRHGVGVEEFAARIVSDHVTQSEDQKTSGQPLLDLLAQWDREDATRDPKELARREEQWEQFRRGMNENSLSGRPVYP